MNYFQDSVRCDVSEMWGRGDRVACGVITQDTKVVFRSTTAMVYLSDLDSGGFTIFPKLGLFFEPKAGNLLFWNLKRTDGTVDERLAYFDI